MYPNLYRHRVRTVECRQTMTETEYPTADEIHAAHARIVARNDDTDAGVRTPDAVESALVYVSEGYFGQAPETIHEKAAHLMRLLASEHPYVDGNKRTALAATVTFYNINGYEFEYGDGEIRRILRQFATDESDADMDAVVAGPHIGR